MAIDLPVSSRVHQGSKGRPVLTARTQQEIEQKRVLASPPGGTQLCPGGRFMNRQGTLRSISLQSPMRAKTEVAGVRVRIVLVQTTGIGLAAVTALDDDRFEQNVKAVIRAPADWPGRRLHTLNRVGRLEFIDGSAHSPRNQNIARLVEAWSGRRAYTSQDPTL